MLNTFVSRAAAVVMMAGGALWSSFAFASVTAHVVTEAKSGLTASGLGIIGTAGDLESCPGCVASISSTGTVVTATGTSQSDSFATASAEYGVLRSYATAASNGVHGYARGTATASFSDAFVIGAAGLAGQHGTVVMPLEFGYTSSRSGLAASQLSVTLDVNAGAGATNGLYQRSRRFNSDATVSSDSFDPGRVIVPFGSPLLATVDFVFGQPIIVIAMLKTTGGGSFDESFTLDAMHSAYWGGFRSVADAAGNPVTYSVSGGQVDWSMSFIPSAVPEPGAYLLMLTGLCVVGFVLRARTSPRALHCASAGRLAARQSIEGAGRFP